MQRIPVRGVVVGVVLAHRDLSKLYLGELELLHVVAERLESAADNVGLEQLLRGVVDDGGVP